MCKRRNSKDSARSGCDLEAEDTVTSVLCVLVIGALCLGGLVGYGIRSLWP